MMLNDDFWQKKPVELIEWQDKRSSAKGILVMNELISGVCAGGTRVSLTTNVQELTHLAKVMQLKFSVYGPAIGGAKSGIMMDPNDPDKYAVLKRWFDYIKPLLKTSYATAADLNTDFFSIQKVLNSIGIPHPQYAIIRSMYKDAFQVEQTIERMKILNQPLVLEDQLVVTLAQMVTGYLIAKLAKKSFDQSNQSIQDCPVVVQGVGTVGSAAAYYLHQLGAKVIGLIDIDGAVMDEAGFSKQSLMHVLSNFSIKKTFLSSHKIMDHHEFYREIHNHSIALFIPAAGSYWVDEKLAQLLIQCRCQLIVSGANIPFKNAQVLENLKQHMRVVESYMSSGGMACALSVLLNHKHAIQTPEEVLHAIDGVACGLELY